MPSLPNPFENRPFEIFEPEEICEPLLMLYTHLALVLRYPGNSLLLNKTELAHVAGGRRVMDLSLVPGDASVYESLRKNLLLIFERDDLIRQRFRLEQTDDNLTVHVVR